MPTVNDLVEDAQSALRGYVRNQEQVTYLTADVTETGTTLQVANGSRLSAGRVGIDNEILEIDSVDGTQVNVFPFGRGADGSTAEPHAANSRVVANPLFPRFRVKQEVVESIRSVATQVPGIATMTFEYTPSVGGFNLPEDFAQVVNVQAEVPGLPDSWKVIRRYKVEKQADTTDFAGGNALKIGSGAWPGMKVKVTYTRTAPTEISLDDDFVTDFGMRQTCRDVIVQGAVARILSMEDISRLDPSSVQALLVDEKRMPGASNRIVAQLWAIYRERLAEERTLFLNQNPTGIRYER